MIQTPRRSSATVGALMVGLMFVFSTASYIQSYRQMIDRWMNQVLNADIFVATSAMLRSTSYHFTEDLGRQIAALPGVERVENVRFTAIPYRGDTAAVIAIEMDGFLARSQNAIEGADSRTVHDRLTRGEGVLVSRNFALRWGVGVGNRLTLESPTGTLERPILGFLDDYRSEKGTIFMDRALYKKYWGDDAVDFIDVDLNPGVDQLAMKQASRAAHRRLLSRVRVHQCGVQAMDLQPGGPVLHAQLHAAGRGRDDRHSRNRQHAADFRSRSGGARSASSAPSAGCARKSGNWCCWRRWRWPWSV